MWYLLCPRFLLMSAFPDTLWCQHCPRSSLTTAFLDNMLPVLYPFLLTAAFANSVVTVMPPFFTDGGISKVIVERTCIKLVHKRVSCQRRRKFSTFRQLTKSPVYANFHAVSFYSLFTLMHVNRSPPCPAHPDYFVRQGKQNDAIPKLE